MSTKKPRKCPVYYRPLYNSFGQRSRIQITSSCATLLQELSRSGCVHASKMAAKITDMENIIAGRANANSGVGGSIVCMYRCMYLYILCTYVGLLAVATLLCSSDIIAINNSWDRVFSCFHSQRSLFGVDYYFLASSRLLGYFGPFGCLYSDG